MPPRVSITVPQVVAFEVLQAGALTIPQEVLAVPQRKDLTDTQGGRLKVTQGGPLVVPQEAILAVPQRGTFTIPQGGIHKILPGVTITGISFRVLLGGSHKALKAEVLAIPRKEDLKVRQAGHFTVPCGGPHKILPG